MKLSDNALTTLEKRYFLRDENGNVVEDAEGLVSRIAYAIAAVEKTDEDKAYWFKQFRDLIDNNDFLPNSPTIMNAGIERGQLSACYVLPIEDSIEGIFNTLRDTAKIHQSGGGTGFSGARMRPKDTIVDSKQGVASGPNSFMSVYDQATEIMKQGGRRKGANMYVQRVDHPDILEFIDLKMTPGVMTNFNVSVAITDEFMKALERDGTYRLYHPITGVTGELRARDVWDKIASNAHRSAEPGIVFIDRINARSPYQEPIEATNPCGEQPLPPYGSCNLGSIDLSNFVEEWEPWSSGVVHINWHRLASVVRVATRFLDNVIDANAYPTPELAAHAQRYRNIGLGGMGLADMFIKLGIRYDSEEAVKLAKKIGWFLNRIAHDYSVQLGKEKGLPSGAPFKTFFVYSRPERRNATLTTWAPTGTLSMLLQTSSGCEPNFAFEMEMHRMGMVLTEYHPIYKLFKDLDRLDDRFVDTNDISVYYHVNMQAALQANCDSAISKTINLHKEASIEDVEAAYTIAWRTGCKGITVYRDGSREGVLHRQKEEIKESEETFIFEVALEDACCEAPNIINEAGCETCKNCGTSKCLIA